VTDDKVGLFDLIVLYLDAEDLGGQDFRRSSSWTQRRNFRQNSGMHFSNNSLSLDTTIDRIQDTQLNVINRPNTGDRQLNETGARVGPRP